MLSSPGGCELWKEGGDADLGGEDHPVSLDSRSRHSDLGQGKSPVSHPRLSTGSNLIFSSQVAVSVKCAHVLWKLRNLRYGCLLRCLPVDLRGPSGPAVDRGLLGEELTWVGADLTGTGHCEGKSQQFPWPDAGLGERRGSTR